MEVVSPRDVLNFIAVNKATHSEPIARAFRLGTF